ncbi:hypothetical protein L226DRAFT_532580 [Lentinus tigrinus ALCF2SS1-7]|uniref:HIT-type domain-containing protein n=1 Tax=Lentinus tigrinus ALCF2SS1-6 TaxID=1328759 RepID=A0A5C2SF85_9APHY|nr:hypothetical protein L227DRAFT_35471 [Lentinus tigrinus ALCF2SS1-6]RPD77811.1 hypothetical protein L226DRAFT_532580 [Lentinus tigrinus ALCF2SS1-7]
MTSTSTRTASLRRPAVKRANYTWPGDASSRTHFEDFLKELGSTDEIAHLCCIPRSNGIPCAHAHMRRRSASNVGSKARSSSRAASKARASPIEEEVSPKALTESLRPQIRGRTMSSPKVSGQLTSGLPVSLKSPALSSIDIENHDASATYNYLASARDSLLSFMSGLPIEERPSRAPTRTFRDHSTSTSPGASSNSRAPSKASTSPASRPRTISRVSQQRSPTRFSTRGRSPSPTSSIDSLDTASSSEAPATPRTHSILAHELPASSSLEELERTSRFRVPCVCMTCKRAGSNFPSCAKCGDMWCSRECRVGTAGTHACHGRMVSA